MISDKQYNLAGLYFLLWAIIGDKNATNLFEKVNPDLLSDILEKDAALELLPDLITEKEVRSITGRHGKYSKVNKSFPLDTYINIDFLLENTSKEYLLVYPNPENEEEYLYCKGKHLKALWDELRHKVITIYCENIANEVERDLLFFTFSTQGLQPRTTYFTNNSFYYADYLRPHYENLKQEYPTLICVFDAAPPAHESAFMILGKNKIQE